MLACERFARCTDRVELIRLGAVTTRRAARTVDLEHQLALSLKKHRQSRAIAACSLDCPGSAAWGALTRETQQPSIAALIRGDGDLSLHDRRVRGEDRRAMRVAMRVDAEHMVGLVCQHEIRPPVLGVCLSVLGLGNRNRKGQDCDESRPTQRGGQASDQATSGGQAGTGSNRRTDQAKSTRAERRASACEGHVHRHQGQPEHQTRRFPTWGNVDYNAVAERTFTTQQLLYTHSQCI